MALLSTQGFGGAEVERTFAGARALSRELEGTAQLFPVLFGLWFYHLGRGDRQATPELAEELLRIAGTSDDSVLRIMAHAAVAATLAYSGDFQRSCESCAQTLTLYDSQQHRSLGVAFSVDPAEGAHAFTALSLACLGYLNRSWQSAAQGIAWAEAIAHPHSLAQAYTVGYWVRNWRGEFEESEDLVDKSVALSTEQVFPWWLGMGIMFRGIMQVRRGEVAVGIDQVREGLSLYRATGNQSNLSVMLAWFADTLVKAGRAKEAWPVVEEGLALVRSNLDTWFESEMHRLKGELLLLDEADPGAPESCFQRALEVARAQNAKWFELRAAMSVARLWQSQGKPKQARELLAPVYDWFTEGFDTQDLKDAKALLEDIP
jgi:predicted ATPase